MHSKSLLDWLELALLFSENAIVTEVPQQDESLWAWFFLKYECFINILPFIMQPVVNTSHEISFVSLVSNFYSLSLNLGIAVFQRQIYTVNLFFYIEHSYSTPPSLPVPSEIAIDCSAPVKWFVLQGFSGSN